MLRYPRGTRFALGVLILVLLAGTGCGNRSQVSTSTSAPPPTVRRRPTPSPTAGPLLVVSDAQAAQAVSFAYVQNNDVWVSLHGAQPQQMTHLGLDPQAQLDWLLFWSPDASQLLATASSASGQGQAWLLSLTSGTASPFPPLCAGPCVWAGERYLIYPTDLESHWMRVGLYDVQQRRAVPSALDSEQAIVDDLEARGSAVYFSPYVISPPQSPQDGVVDRFDLTANTITTAYTLPAPVVSEGIPLFNAWDLSGAGNRLVAAFPGSAQHCPQQTCYTYYEDSAGAVSVLFPTHQSQQAGIASDVRISPDGTMAVGIVASSSGAQYSVVEQALPAGSETTTAIPTAADVLGWTTGDSVLMYQNLLDHANEYTAGSLVWIVRSGASQPELVETIHATSEAGRPVEFAPPSAE